MRLWSIHPKYLDTKGLTACWREGLLARNVLIGATKGYKHHPQLIRFRQTAHPLASIDSFLRTILEEATRRGYRFDASKIGTLTSPPIPVTRGQLRYEFEHLKQKLARRDRVRLAQLVATDTIHPNPFFVETEGEVESWEKTEANNADSP